MVFLICCKEKERKKYSHRNEEKRLSKRELQEVNCYCRLEIKTNGTQRRRAGRENKFIFLSVLCASACHISLTKYTQLHVLRKARLLTIFIKTTT